MEFSKEFLVSTPQAYYIGLTNDCFSSRRFFGMIGEGIFNGLMLMTLSYYGFNDCHSVSQKSKAGEFWVDGNLMYMCLVIIANMKIAFKTHNHTWIGTSIIVGTVLSYFLWYEAENILPGAWPLYRTWNQIFSRANAYWICLILLGFNYTQNLLFYWADTYRNYNQAQFKQLQELRQQRLN